MDSQKTEKNKTIGYTIVNAIAFILCSCFVAIVIGLTIKFLLWLLF